VHPATLLPTKSKLCWYQFRLRTLLLFVLVVSVGMSWLAVRMEKLQRQREIIREIQKESGYIFYDYELDSSFDVIPSAEPPGPKWIRDLLGDDFFCSVTAVVFYQDQDSKSYHVSNRCMANLQEFPDLEELKILFLRDQGKSVRHIPIEFSDTAMQSIGKLRNLKILWIMGPEITDARLEHLKNLDQLQELSLFGMQITDDGLLNLKKMTSLNKLYLASTEITDSGIIHLQELKQLEYLRLYDTRVTKSGIEQLKKKLSNLIISK
jgi:hypothetical protein